MLVVKNYQMGVSSQLHRISQNKITLTGPYGPHLNFEEKGKHVIFAAGTGVLPFLDMIAKFAESRIFRR